MASSNNFHDTRPIHTAPLLVSSIRISSQYECEPVVRFRNLVLKDAICILSNKAVKKNILHQSHAKCNMCHFPQSSHRAPNFNKDTNKNSTLTMVMSFTADGIKRCQLGQGHDRERCRKICWKLGERILVQHWFSCQKILAHTSAEFGSNGRSLNKILAGNYSTGGHHGLRP